MMFEWQLLSAISTGTVLMMADFVRFELIVTHSESSCPQSKDYLQPLSVHMQNEVNLALDLYNLSTS